uniref:protein-serine/threonine phosphatase n=1 Tax=Arundo donax TaxID=35708 RepID=A0A0A9DRH7_ARUDO
MSRTNAWTNQATPRPQITRTTPHATAAPAAQDRALRKTEEAYLDVADNMVGEFPKLALMGCCVIAMLMKGDGMYFMNVGHNHAVLGTMDSADLQQISVGSFHGLVGDCSRCLSAVQITGEHSTSVQEEVYRIRNDHPDDPLQSPRITLRNP